MFNLIALVIGGCVCKRFFNFKTIFVHLLLLMTRLENSSSKFLLSRSDAHRLFPTITRARRRIGTFKSWADSFFRQKRGQL
jgi:hypothetical protein